MPSFLTKVFGRKKDEKEPTAHARKRLSQPSLLEGKYEAVSPNVSPSATHFSEPSSRLQPPAKESPLSLFRSRSRHVLDQSRQSNAPSVPAPHLTLNLPVPKEEKSRALGVVFEADPENVNSLPEEIIGERRLSPLETLLLVKACSAAIIDRGGLESLGLMHPHWYSASPEVQRKLISLFVLSLGPKSPVTTLSPSSTSPSLMFETELNYTRDPHDIASVLRWGLRHLQLEGSSFGKSSSTSSEWKWYADFATSERDGGYPSTAFSKSLVPLLPPAHLQLLAALLDTMSSLAAHAETTGTSGSKLARLFGLWLLSTERVKSSEDWAAFYQRWERAGRVLEHLFLAHVREEAEANKMPLRLSELVKQYPYLTAHEKDASDVANDLPYLPIPRFSTRRRDAVFVRVDTLLPSSTTPRPAKGHPLRLIGEALKTSAAADAFRSEEVRVLWEEIKAKASEGAEDTDVSSALSKILDDESLRLLSLIPAGTPNPSAPSSPLYNTSSPSSPTLLAPDASRLRSASVGTPTENGKTTSSNGHGKMPTTSSLSSWADFSTAGFGESALDKTLTLSISDDVEITQPRRQASRAKSPLRGRRSSVDSPAPLASTNDTAESKLKGTLKRVDLVQVDEAFFDFWNDALLDPIAASWPAFVVCQLKGFSASLLVVEQTYTLPAPPLRTQPSQPEPTTRRAASPRPSVSASVGSARKSFTLSPTIKRFSFFSSNDGASKTVKKTGAKSTTSRTPRIGEMGEMLPEEDERTTPPMPARAKKASPELPAVPLVDAPAPAPPAEVAPVATEPVRTESDAPEKPTAALHEDTVVPKDDTSIAQENETEKELPAAPEGVVLAGATPGPQVALESSEIKTLVEAQEEAKSAEEAETAAPADPEPVVERATETAAAVVAPSEPEVPDTQEPTAVGPVAEVQEPTAVEPAHQEPVHEATANELAAAPSAPEEPDVAPPVPSKTEASVPAEDAPVEVVEDAAPQSEELVSSPELERIEEPAAADVPVEQVAPATQVVEQAEESAPVVEAPAATVEDASAQVHPEQPESTPQVDEPEVKEELTESEPKEEEMPAEPTATEIEAPEVATEHVEASSSAAPTEAQPATIEQKTTLAVEEAGEKTDESSHANGTSHAADDTQEPEPQATEEPLA